MLGDEACSAVGDGDVVAAGEALGASLVTCKVKSEVKALTWVDAVCAEAIGLVEMPVCTELVCGDSVVVGWAVDSVSIINDGLAEMIAISVQPAMWIPCGGRGVVVGF